MSSFEEIANILCENLIPFSYEDVTYEFHKNDHVIIKNSSGNFWDVYRKAAPLNLRVRKDSSHIDSFIHAIKNPESYVPGILVKRKNDTPYEMRVFTRLKDGRVKVENFDYDETFIANAIGEEVLVKFLDE